jgi:phenylalanyl-tRNA synthetase alpha chain
MTELLNRIDQNIGRFKLSSPEEVKQLFDDLREEFTREVGNKIDPKDLETLRVRWIGRSERSIKRRIVANWIRVESPFRKEVGENYQDLFADNGFVARKLAEQRAIWDAVPAIAQDQAQYPAYPGALRQQDSAPHFTSVTQKHYFDSVGNDVFGPLADRGVAPESTLLPVDLSLPGVVRSIGSRHLIRQVFQEIEDIFVSIGFSVVEGPEIETPYYNFEALNIPEHHPVRDDMDTFYIDLPKGAPTPLLLRTHTSPMQIRTMERQKPPVRVIVPGKVYRRDNPDATHSFAFHQIEGLAVDTDITFCDFTGTIEYFVKQFFGPSVKTRFRPSYFPFTEPSVEFDVSCPFCGGTGTAAGGGTCSKCKGAAWIELFGAGMVDPAVYGFVNYDAKKVSGFAFGIGIDRLAMLKYGIDDIQVFFQNDVRFLKQFP